VREWLEDCFTNHNMEVIRAVQHSPGKRDAVLELAVRKPRKLKYLAGQYVYINCPAVSEHEWHPFTLTSAPSSNELSVHMAAVGDWTKSIFDLFPPGWEGDDEDNLSKGSTEWDQAKQALADELDKNGEVQTKKEEIQVMMPRLSLQRSVYIDGPYGAPAQDFTRYKVAILIGAGIGVTPFAAVIKNIQYIFKTWRTVDQPLQGLAQISKGATYFPIDFELTKVYFHWSTKSQESMGWFKESMEALCEQDTENMFEMHNYLTSAKMDATSAASGLFNIAYRKGTESSNVDMVTGLTSSKVHTHFDRPDYDKIFQDVKAKHEDVSKIGVFYCGPKVIRSMLNTCCKTYSDDKYSGYSPTRFKLHAENF